MSNLIFDEKIFNDIENNRNHSVPELSVTADGQLVETEPMSMMGEIQSKLDGIEMGMESIVSLTRIRDALKKSMKPSQSAINIGSLAVESIKRSVDIFSHPDIVSVECFRENEVSLEGLDNVIKTIWDAIVRTFKAIWDNIHYVIKYITGKDRKQQVEEILKANDQSQKENPNAEISPERVAEAFEESAKNTQTVMTPFAFLGKTVTLSQISSLLELLMKSTRACLEWIRTIEEITMRFDHSVTMFEKGGINDSTLKEIRYATRLFLEIPEKLLGNDRLEPFQKELREKLNVSYHLVDNSTVREFIGLTRGDRVFVFRMKDRDDEGVENAEHWFRLFRVNGYDYEINTGSPELKCELSQASIDQYGQKLLRANEDISYLNRLYEKDASFFQKRQQELMDRMGKYLQRIDPDEETGDGVNSRDRVMVYRTVTHSLSRMISAINTCIVDFERTREDHFQLFKAVAELHAENLKKSSTGTV